jgi:outer membrane protein assembly factor BamA
MMSLLRPSRLLALLLLAMMALVLSAQGHRLGKISVTGSHRFSEVQIIQASGLRIGASVTQDDLQGAANRLGATGAFKNVAFQFRIEAGNLSVTYQVEDAARFLRCEYDNFVWFTAEQINQAVQHDVPLFDGSLPDSDELATSVAAALERLLSARHLGGPVTFVETGELGKAASGYLFKVEGEPVVVASMEVVGPLEPSLFSAEQKRLVGKAYSSSFAMLLAEKDLKQVYQNHGYLRATIANPRTALLEGAPQTWPYQVSVTFTVTSGLQYSWDREDWDGNRALPSDALDKLLGMHSREIAAADRIAKGFEAVLAEYGTKGFILARFSVDPSYNEAASSVTYHVHLVEGQQFHMGELVLSGIPASVAKEIQGKWRLQPGDVYDASYARQFATDRIPGILVSTHFPNLRLKLAFTPHISTGTVTVEITPL